MASALFYEKATGYGQSQKVAAGNHRLALLHNKKSFGKLISKLF